MRLRHRRNFGDKPRLLLKSRVPKKSSKKDPRPAIRAWVYRTLGEQIRGASGKQRLEPVAMARLYNIDHSLSSRVDGLNCRSPGNPALPMSASAFKKKIPRI